MVVYHTFVLVAVYREVETDRKLGQKFSADCAVTPMCLDCGS